MLPEPAPAAPMQPQILRRDEPIPQIHPIPVTPNSSGVPPYSDESESRPASGDRSAPPVETPPPPPPIHTRQPALDDDLLIPATPDSGILQPSYADIVKRHKSTVMKAHLHRQPTARTLQSAITTGVASLTSRLIVPARTTLLEAAMTTRHLTTRRCIGSLPPLQCAPSIWLKQSGE